MYTFVVRLEAIEDFKFSGSISILLVSPFGMYMSSQNQNTNKMHRLCLPLKSTMLPFSFYLDQKTSVDVTPAE